MLPSNDGNTDMRLVGGTMYPGGTAIFEITYPVNAANVGKEFTILDCAYIDDVATLKYTVSFVPSNQSFVLSLTLAVPTNAPVGGSTATTSRRRAAPPPRRAASGRPVRRASSFAPPPGRALRHRSPPRPR